MKNKKLPIIILIVLLLVFGVLAYLYFGKEDKNTTLTASEKNWIESNKNSLIDLSIPSNVPVLSNNGAGIIFDFLTDLEKDTGLEFNKLSYTDKPTSTYALKLKEKNTNNILVYKDNYALVSNSKIKFTSTKELNNKVIGVLEEDIDQISKYLLGSGEPTYKSYKDISSMIKELEEKKVDIIAIPELANLDKIIKNKNLYLAYNITEYTKDFVLELGKNSTLNKILTKYYTKWSKENFDESFNKNLIDNYFAAKKIDEKEQVIFRSKRYSYGFTQNSPFDIATRNGLRGFNYSLLSNFAKSSNIEIDYKKYSNVTSLVKDFSENKLDIIFDYNSNDKYNMDVYKTISVYNEEIYIIADQNTKTIINSINSLTDETIFTIKNSKIDKYLTNSGVKTKTFDNIKELINKINKNDLAAIDEYTYDYYVRNELSNFKKIYTFNLDEDYNFISRDISTNKTFNELLNFYLSFENSNQMMNNSYKELLNYNNNNKMFKTLIVLFSIVLLALIGAITKKMIKKHKNPHPKLSKSDKLRYIDTMPSLKNRNYLNDNIDAWDNSDVYPQAVIIIDLNNIAYINDNFGHAEGDKVIVEGASILIANQLPNSDIIRTNGNEFLIFMLGQDEKSVITYIRKLHKEFKKISHGFGAAIGYSIISDEIKTIDDAVNEATLDMRNNKEENKQ